MRESKESCSLQSVNIFLTDFIMFHFLKEGDKEHTSKETKRGNKGEEVKGKKHKKQVYVP